MIGKTANQHKTRQSLLLTVTIGVAILAGLLAWRFAPAFLSSTDEVSIGQASYVINPDDDRELAGFASDVFFGRVTENLGQFMSGATPMSQFNAEVLEVLRGSLSGTIKVQQRGGTF